MVVFLARVRLKLPTEGGRVTPFAHSGYRPNLRFGETYVGAALQTDSGEPLAAGQWEEVLLTVPSGDQLPAECFAPNARFLVTEGSHIVGAGVVTEPMS